MRRINHVAYRSSMKALLCFPLVFSARKVGAQFTVISAVSGTVPGTDTVELTCEFTNKWLEESHPLAYPTANARWSPMILASHTADYSMWKDGELASPAMQIVADTGVKLTMLAELENATTVLDQQSGKALKVFEQQSQSLPALTVDADHPFISTVTKILPSPDWFSGFTDFRILDASSNTWLASFEIETFPWDAGTDSGLFYRSDNDPTDPPIPIDRIQVQGDTSESRGLPQEGVFVSPDGTEVLPVATWVCSVAAVATPTEVPSTGDPSVAPTISDPVSTAVPSDSDIPTAAPAGSTLDPTVPPIGASSPPTASPTVSITTTPTTAPPTSRPTSPITPFTIVTAVPGSGPASPVNGYSCMIENEWTELRHPNDYPTRLARWSPSVIASHSNEFQMWENGQTASPGVRQIVRSGNPSLMIGELSLSDEGVLDYRQGSPMNVSLIQNATLPPVLVNDEFPFLSTIASIMPSPDWFSGFYNVSMQDQSGTWYDRIVIETFPWDAGTDAGETYRADASPTVPSSPITQLNVETIPDSGVFLNSDTSAVLPVSKWTCSRVQPPPPRPQRTSGVSAPTVSSFVTVLLLLGMTAIELS